MKVICVMKVTRIDERCIDAPRPEVLGRYNVKEVFKKPDTGTAYYILEGFPDHLVYHSELFAILPDTSEEVASEHDQEAIIYQK